MPRKPLDCETYWIYNRRSPDKNPDGESVAEMFRRVGRAPAQPDGSRPIPSPPPWRRRELQFPLAAGPGRRETSALPVALGSSRVPCGLCNSHRRGEGEPGRMLDGRSCLNFECIDGWRTRRARDPWWDTYLEERVAGPAKAPEADVSVSEGRKRHFVQEDETDESSSHERWIELGRAPADAAAFLAEGGWHIEHAGTTGGEEGRPTTGITDRALIEAYARSRLDGTFEDALSTLSRGPAPKHLRAYRAQAEQVIAELVNERNANTNAVKNVFDCSRRLVQEIAKRAR